MPESPVRCLMLLAFTLSLATLGSGCFTTRHTFGDGPRGVEVRTHHRWYAFWGFVPLDGLDSREVIGPSQHYRVRRSFRALDVAITVFTGPLGFFRNTTLIEK